MQAIEAGQDFGIAQLAAQRDGVVRAYAATHRIANCSWLLMNFLEHEMRITFFFRHLGSPGNRLGRTTHALAAGILDLNCFAADDRNLAIIEENHFSRVWQKGGNVRCDEVFPRSDSDDERRPVACGHNLLSIAFSRDNDNSIE